MYSLVKAHATCAFLFMCAFFLRISKRMRALVRAGMLQRMHACIRRLIRTRARIFLACACCFRSFIRIFCVRMRARMWKVLKARYVSRDARLAILECAATRCMLGQLPGAGCRRGLSKEGCQCAWRVFGRRASLVCILHVRHVGGKQAL